MSQEIFVRKQYPDYYGMKENGCLAHQGSGEITIIPQQRILLGRD